MKRGRLLEKRRMCRLKKLWFFVEKEGYPVPRPFFNLDDSHMADVPLDPGNALVGLDRPLPMSRPGVAQPPPGKGDGLRDRDIGVFGVPEERGQRANAHVSQGIAHQRPPSISVTCRHPAGGNTGLGAGCEDTYLG